MAFHRAALYGLLALLIGLVSAVPARASAGPFQTGTTLWRGAAGGYAGWTLTGVTLARDRTLRLNPRSAATESDPYGPGGYQGHNYYNGGTYLVGEATSPAANTPFAFGEAVTSWNAATPKGTWVETQIRAYTGDHWTGWYSLGVWAADESTVRRHSVDGQDDADGQVATDTLVLERAEATAFQVRVRLFAEKPGMTPLVRNVSVAYSTPAARVEALEPGNPERWGKVLRVPTSSQMVYPDGGNLWCSPTSVSMILGYWGIQRGESEPRVRAAVDGVYDWLYDGHGNWPFNTAYAGSYGLEAHVARFTSLAQAEEWIAAGVPVAVSIGWGQGELTGAPIAASSGHLMVLAGFDRQGNPVVNDPAAASDAEVRRTYDRAEFETLWLERTGGTVYLIYLPGLRVPALGR